MSLLLSEDTSTSIELMSEIVEKLNINEIFREEDPNSFTSHTFRTVLEASTVGLISEPRCE